MKQGRVINLILAGALLVGLPGCTEKEPESSVEPTATPVAVAETEGREFVLPCYPAGGFHPITGTNRTNLTLAPLLYRGLFSVDRQFQAQNDLCESYTVSEDGLNWTFRLADATFSDGTPLTAEETAASLNQARQSARYKGRLAGISRVTAGEGEITVTLSQPNGALPLLLDVPIVKETEDPQRPLGTGPYRLAETEEGLELVARGTKTVPVERIGLRSISASDDLVYAFDAQEISLVDTDLTGSNALGYSGRFETADYPTTTLLYVGCNVRSGVCQDEKVRRALARAFDREAIAGKLLAGHGAASALPVHPLAEGYGEALAEGLAYDLEAARKLLAAAGWQTEESGRLRKGRNDLTLRLIVNQDNTYKVTVAEELARSLEELGCVVTLEKLPWDDFVAALGRRDFDLYLGETVLTADFDLEALLGASGTLNYGGYVDGETNTRMAEYRAATGEERKAAADALYARVAEMSPIVPLCFKNGSLLIQWGQVSGAEPTQRDVFAGLENWTVAQF